MSSPITGSKRAVRVLTAGCWGAAGVLLAGGLVGVGTVQPATGQGHGARLASTTTVTASSPIPTSVSSPLPVATTTPPAPTPAGWTLVRGVGWRIALPATPEVGSVSPHSAVAPYRSVTTYTIVRSAEGGMYLSVFEYPDGTEPGTTAFGLQVLAGVSKGTLGSISLADVGGRPGQTAPLARPGDGPGRLTAFVSGQRLFILGSQDSSVHARILSTFGT